MSEERKYTSSGMPVLDLDCLSKKIQEYMCDIDRPENFIEYLDRLTEENPFIVELIEKFNEHELGERYSCFILYRCLESQMLENKTQEL